MLAALSAAALITIAACGGDDDDDTSATTAVAGTDAVTEDTDAPDTTESSSTEPESTEADSTETTEAADDSGGTERVPGPGENHVEDEGEPVKGGTLVYGVEADTANAWPPYRASYATSGYIPLSGDLGLAVRGHRRG